MSQIITVVYENGLLRPLVPLNLPEQQTIQIQIVSQATPAQRYIQQLVALGLITPPSGQPEDEPIAEVQRQQLADRLGKMLPKPLSEIIIEERDPW